MASRSGTDQHRSLTSSHSCRVKELVSIHGLLTFFFFLCFLPAECSQNGLKPGVAAKTSKGWFSCRCCGIMRHSPLQTECHFTMPISAIARCNLHPAHVQAAEIATRELNADFTTVMLEGRYTDAYLTKAGADAPQFTDDELKTIASPLDFVGINVYKPNIYVTPLDD